MSHTVIRILVASKNPVKVTAAHQAFSQVFPNHTIHCEGVNVDSGVADQPMTESETRLGAQTRVRNCIDMDTDTKEDYFVAMEGGVDQFEEGAATFAYVCISGRDKTIHTGRSANLPLPNSVYQRLVCGDELGQVMDDVFKMENIKQKGGAIGVLTNNLATRESTYTQALILAMAPILHPDLYV
ncbi:inosine/xanthosine triphosphatase [Marinomonas pollencensis]|uniref:Inosine/xanthosine triphosphatase n=1 Tax=Marinomonas pollencensis TaxID=491954 RepID=A0A3E0DVP3_9GAMM|nr:inosine/xanthosine triphosphatase [Marinomonas pollencensis]REG85719.1 inosine/xanthosine triphosphatase [Marinomonas pollencensis]